MRAVRPLLTAIAAAALAAAPAPAFLYWIAPVFPSDPVTGIEPDIALPLPGATPAEVRANLLWTLRAGLNVAALQCQFAPALLSVRYYNDIVRTHAPELLAAYKAIDGYFRRTAKKTAQVDLDGYTTRTYNGFTSFHAQIGFCDTAAAIARDAMQQPAGQLYRIAERRMRALRTAQQQPMGDAAFAFGPPAIRPPATPDDVQCYAYDRKGRRIDCETGKRIKEPKAG